MKQTLTSILIGIGLFALADTPAITNVTAQQRYPWNGKVDITYTVTGDVEEEAKARALMSPTIKVTAIDQTTGNAYTASALSGDMGLSSGTHALVWDMNADGLFFTSGDVVFDVSCVALPSFCIVDLSGGVNASSYPVTYLDNPPLGGFNTDEFKTTKLVLRRLEPGQIPTRDVTLTKPFYIALFEVTQRQWELVMGNRPSYFANTSYYATRPVEEVSYDMIRGSSSGSQWPASTAVDSGSFLGKLRARTGLDFDLPTEAQWEYACRAGTISDYNNGGYSENDLKVLGRYRDSGGSGGTASSTTANGTAAVGSYRPNAWGLYDMHGNVTEWCLDWNGASMSGVDPVGSSSGSYRMIRGGTWNSDADLCTSSIRGGTDPWYTSFGDGFRLVRVLSD